MSREKSKQIQIRISEKLYLKLKNKCEDEGRSMSETIRNLIAMYLSSNTKININIEPIDEKDRD